MCILITSPYSVSKPRKLFIYIEWNFTSCWRIRRIVLVANVKRFDGLSRYQLYLMAHPDQPPCPVLRPGAGFHSDPPGIALLSFPKIRPLSEQSRVFCAFAPSNNSTGQRLAYSVASMHQCLPEPHV
jgi:hypothetical protein